MSHFPNIAKVVSWFTNIANVVSWFTNIANVVSWFTNRIARLLQYLTANRSRLEKFK